MNNNFPQGERLNGMLVFECCGNLNVGEILHHMSSLTGDVNF